MTASASMPPTPQPSTPSPLIIVVCESVPTSVSGNATPSWSSHDQARGTPGSPGGRSPCRAGRRGSCGTPPAPSAGAGSARRFARTRARCCAPYAPSEPNASTCTEWSITRSTGTSGSTRPGSPWRRATAARSAARSTTAGTPVRSCMSTRAGMKASSGAGRGRRPCRQRAHVLLAHVHGPGPAQQVLEEHAHRVGERQRVDDAVEAIEGLAAGEGGAGAEGIVFSHDP